MPQPKKSVSLAPLDQADQLAAATGTNDPILQLHLLQQVLDAMRGPNEPADRERLDRAVIGMLEAIGPQDGLEGAMAAQMVATHHVVMDCLRRAALSQQTLEEREMNLKHAAKLQSLYLRQVEVLDKHRGKGQQTVTVEHVHVQAGGQAIVGLVEAGVSGAMDRKTARALVHAPGVSTRHFHINERAGVVA